MYYFLYHSHKCYAKSGNCHIKKYPPKPENCVSTSSKMRVFLIINEPKGTRNYSRPHKKQYSPPQILVVKYSKFTSASIIYQNMINFDFDIAHHLEISTQNCKPINIYMKKKTTVALLCVFNCTKRYINCSGDVIAKTIVFNINKFLQDVRKGNAFELGSRYILKLDRNAVQ